MPPGPAHARQRRRRLLALISTLLVVSAFSPRLQETLFPQAESPERSLVTSEVQIAMRSTAPAAPSQAEQTTRGSARDPLFTLVPAPSEAAGLESESPVPARSIHYVDLNDALLVGKDSPFWKPGARVSVPLPDGRTLEVEIEQTEATGPDSFTSTAHVVGVPEGRAIFAYVQGRLSARFENLPQGDLQLRPLSAPNGKEVNQLYVVDPALVPSCGGEMPMEPNHDGAVQFVEVDGGKLIGPAPIMAGDQPLDLEEELEPLVSGQAVIDVLMAYTKQVRAKIGSDAALLAQIQLGLAKVNSDFAASGITARVRLAGTIELDYPEEEWGEPSRFQATTLKRLQTRGDGYLDEVHDARDAFGADLVCLLVQREDPGSSGIAYALTDPWGYAGSHYAFSVVHASFVSGAQSVLSHELAHNLGCAHARGDRDTEGSKDGAFPYSYGHRFEVQNTAGEKKQLRTIMAYLPGDRIPYFSNPRLTLPKGASYNGSTYRLEPEPALGVADGSSNAADNARTIEETAFQVASYRISTDFSGAGKLVNVSTRARVGGDEQVMIGGFVVNGTGRSQVLVRAVGPTLGQPPYNVPGALADPQLTVFRGQTPVGINNDWWRPEGAVSAGPHVTRMTEAFQRVGAFALLPNTKDAALLLDLQPGTYTAIVEGADGGQALIEAYEVGASDGRIINLSTRAYGTKSEPIIGGFYVRADPEQLTTRKRMLLRARGPSLAAAGVTNAMADPVMELYDAKGQLVLNVDDWDPPTTTFTGQDTPFVRRNEIDQASEREVDAALRSVGGPGLYPVEPAAVVELPPGLYSLRVYPFEETGRPAQSGVAIIEVFELAGSAR